MSKKTQIGEYSPNEEARAKATAYWRKKDRADLVAELDDIIEQFQAHHRAHGSTMACWDSAFVTWYANSVRFTRKPQAQQSFYRQQPSGSGAGRATRPAFKASDYDCTPSTNLRSIGEILSSRKG